MALRLLLGFPEHKGLRTQNSIPQRWVKAVLEVEKGLNKQSLLARGRERSYLIDGTQRRCSLSKVTQIGI